MPRLCTLKCFPMSVMLFLSSYTLTVTSPHPSTQKRCTYSMRLGFVIPLNTMTNSCCFNTGFVGNEETWPCLLREILGSASPKPFVLHMPAESYEQVSPEMRYSTDKKSRSVFFHLHEVVTNRAAEEEPPSGTPERDRAEKPRSYGRGNRQATRRENLLPSWEESMKKQDFCGCQAEQRSPVNTGLSKGKWDVRVQSGTREALTWLATVVYNLPTSV